jgi:hypothetical protein
MFLGSGHFEGCFRQRAAPVCVASLDFSLSVGGREREPGLCRDRSCSSGLTRSYDCGIAREELSPNRDLWKVTAVPLAVHLPR